MPTAFRNLSAAEMKDIGHRWHERRSADTFRCPHCDADTGASSFVSDPAVCRCPRCEREFYSWTVPGTIHVSAKL